ncbi:type I phosphomannose isomerase catalytic subunit [Phycisphaerales bacterium AB-hyl4]|uniref:Type I phosphomannose isomerase catalytic subunit n=1 Tax=Natronomicrosphaera hydrolytica TaxID=3242702 RepID=A0ABV4U6D4_9BACT
MPIAAYPLTFEPIYKEKVWGGRSLERLGRTLPGGVDARIGESWELADLGTTSASGGGGGAARSIITNGPLAGQSLHDAITGEARALLGNLPLNEFGEFPLLLKYLDARQSLSVQVHPSPAYAAEHDDAFLKSEAWFIVDADPGAVIYKGVHEGVTPEQLRAALEVNDDEAVVPLLIETPVRPGDCHYLPSGTCHALGAGVLVAEVQTPSDTTFRVYDWGRIGRELHVDQALACITFGPPESWKYEKLSLLNHNGTSRTRLVVCEYFRIDRIEAGPGFDEELSYNQPAVWMVLAGEARLTCDAAEPVTLTSGRTVYIPPGMPNARLHVTEPLDWLEITFPQATSQRLA